MWLRCLGCIPGEANTAERLAASCDGREQEPSRKYGSLRDKRCMADLRPANPARATTVSQLAWPGDPNWRSGRCPTVFGGRIVKASASAPTDAQCAMAPP